MKDKIDLLIIEQKRILKYLSTIKFDENKTSGEVAAIHVDIFAVEYSINILKELKNED
jgi:hypothetical protein